MMLLSWFLSSRRRSSLVLISGGAGTSFPHKIGFNDAVALDEVMAKSDMMHLA